MNPRNERGQTVVIAVLALVVLLGMAALVVDVGAWYSTKRQLQATADAAALAGAQQLPDSPGGAKSMAQSYANQNGGNVLGANIRVYPDPPCHDPKKTKPPLQPNSIMVCAAKTESGFFSGVFPGMPPADIGVDATALVGPPAQVQYVAPMTVYCGHDLIQNCNLDHDPTFDVKTTMEFDKMGAPGAFGMLNLENGQGTPGASEEANWILHGFDKFLKPGIYRSDPGGKFESQAVSDALDLRVGTVLLFPVFKTLDEQGQNANYDIIGWIGFYLESWKIHGHNALLTGHFTEFIAHGILASGGGGPGGPSSTWGVKSIQLIE